MKQKDTIDATLEGELITADEVDLNDIYTHMERAAKHAKNRSVALKKIVRQPIYR